MRDFLIGLLVCGCAFPGAECGWGEFGDFDSAPAPVGKCVKITVAGDARVAKEPTDGCAVDDAPGQCVILAPGESAAVFLPATASRAMPGDSVDTTRQNGAISESGTCPLTCP